MSSPLSAPLPQLPVDAPVVAPVVTFLPPSLPPLVDSSTPPAPPVDATTPPPLVDTGTLPPLPKIAPVSSSPQYPPNHTVEVLPPALPPASGSPPQPPVVPTIMSSPPFTGSIISPSSPPNDYASPPSPTVSSPPLPAELPLPSVTSSPTLPTIPSLPTTAPPPPADPLFLSPPGGPLPPPVLPLIPETSTPPLTSPSSPKASPLAPPAGPSTVLPPPAWPGYSPPQPAPILVGQAPPATLSSSLPLPSLNGRSLPVSSKQSHSSTGIVIGCFIGGVFALFLLGLLCICYRRRRTRKAAKAEDYHKPQILISKDNYIEALQPQQNGSLSNASTIAVQTKTFPLPTPSIGTQDSHSLNAGYENPLPPQNHHLPPGLSRGNFSYRELVEATNGFSDSNLLGEGGFGYVHKGVLPSGKEVAVKQLKQGSRQGEREFQTEVDIISQVHHKHLVTLIGYCMAGPARLLVYEFVPNSTLEFHLHETGRPVVEWTTRLKIAIGSAKGLSYLHEDCNPVIIHRDIKAANILLDHEFNAKVSDFGLAKSFSNASGSTSITHVSTQVVGTFGYLAPEYASSGKVTAKSDIYSFGVVLLELITGRPAISATEFITNQSLVVWARPLLTQALEESKFDALVDPKLGSNYNPNQMASMIACAAACVRHSSWLRPQMSQIVHALEGNISVKDLNEGIMKPGQSTYLGFLRSSISSTHQNEVNDSGRTPNSWECGISGYTLTTSDYGIDPSGSSSDATSR